MGRALFFFGLAGGQTMSKYQPQRVSSPKAAAYIGVTNAHLCNMRKDGRGPKFYRYGKRYYYAIKDLEEWVEAQAVDPEAA